MAATSQFFAPSGYGALQPETRYHCLRNDVRRGRVLFVNFFQARRGAQLTVISTSAYEDGLASGAIIPCGSMTNLPPWLAGLDGFNFDLYDDERRKAKRLHRDSVEARLAHIYPLVERSDEILGAADPVVEINSHARQCKPRQNETRLRTWFFCYLAFGYNIWALMPPYHGNGQWSRQDEERVKSKYGRRSVDRGASGYSCTSDMIRTLCDGYCKHAQPGRALTRIYALTITHSFGCRTQRLEDGSVGYFHPKGKPFPSMHQFRYWTNKKFGDEVQRTRFGEQRFRNRIQPNRGTYAQAVACLMEKVEADAYSTSDHPTCFNSERTGPKLFVVRLICVLSGMEIGIGFSHGSETGAAYRGALFCAAIGKSRYGAILGMEIDDEDWPCQGLPRADIPDRGPGGSDAVVSRMIGIVAITEFPPSHTPQSHATVESTHPHDIHLEGTPTYVRSALNAVQMAQREVRFLIARNRSSSAAHRMPLDALRADRLCSRLELWKYMSERGRNDAVQISFEDAVRTFLTKVTFSLENGYLWLKKLRYSSDALADALQWSGYRKQGVITFDGYVLDLCVRNAWVEMRGRLIEVEAQVPIRDDDRQLLIPLSDLDDYAQARLRARRRIEANRAPIESEAIEQSRKAYGVDPWASKRIMGRAKAKTPEALAEVRSMKHLKK